MNIMTVDIGNSRTHWGYFKGKELLDQGNLPSRTAELDFRPILEKTPNRPIPDGVIACSVVPRVSRVLLETARSTGVPVRFLTHERVGALRIQYPRPEEIGPDRLANALGGFLHTEAPFIVIDMGTAVTLDVVTKKNGYEGGAIAPGFSFLSEYLSEKTALLPPINLNKIHRRTGIGRSTTEAMEIGCTKGFSGMIRELVSTCSEEVISIDGVKPTILVTGGSFTWVAESWIGRIPFYQHLTLEGLLSRADDLLVEPEDHS